MTRMHSRIAIAAAIAAVTGIAGIGALKAQTAAKQAPSVKRTVLLRQDSTVAGREAVMAMVELPPGATEGRHTHFAELYAFVLEGTPTLEIDGQPAKTYKAGDVFTVAPGQVHEGKNNGTVTARVSVVMFAEKGKPLTSPAP